MSTVSAFEPRHPQDAHTVLDQIRIVACNVYIWQLLIHPRDPIIRERMLFQIRLPEFAHPVWAMLGVMVMCDRDHTVYQLVTHHLGCPPTVLVALNEEARFLDLTQLTPITPTMSAAHL
jgi:hypothetical protein